MKLSNLIFNLKKMKYFIEYNIVSKKIEIDIDEIAWLHYWYESFNDIPENEKIMVLEEFLSDEDYLYSPSNWFREIVSITEIDDEKLTEKKGVNNF